MKRLHAFAAAALFAVCASPALAKGHIPMDRPVGINGITAVCTGIGEDAQNDPRWKAYPIRVEFSNGNMQYIAGAHVVLKDAHGKPLATFDCSGAWVLFQLPAGKYTVFATLLYHPNQPPSSAAFSPPASGQKRVILTFKGVNANE